LEVRIEDRAKAEQALRQHYRQTTGLSDQAESPLEAAADACPACGAPIPLGQEQCPDCGIRLA